MKFLVFARTQVGVSVPNDRALAVVQATKAWTEALLADGTLDCAYNLPAGGGVAIFNVKSHEQLTELLGAYPFQSWVQYEIHALSDVNHLFNTLIKASGG